MIRHEENYEWHLQPRPVSAHTLTTLSCVPEQGGPSSLNLASQLFSEQERFDALRVHFISVA
jgi:hypothetical protein